MSTMVRFCCLVCLWFTMSTVSAQKRGIEITGTILEAQGNQPVEFATVVIRSNRTENIITGTTSGTGGMFLRPACNQNEVRGI